MTQIAIKDKGLANDRLLARALAFARAMPNENTRRAYAATYRSYWAFLWGEDKGMGVAPLGVDALDRYCEALGRRGRCEQTIARHLSALRSLATELGVTDALAVRSHEGRRAPPRALTDSEYEALLGAVDTRTERGKRDLAILRLLGDGGLRRSELCGLCLSDIVGVTDRLAEPAWPLEHATAYEVLIRKGGATRRRVSLTFYCLGALFDWQSVHPARQNGSLFVSTARPFSPLSDRAIALIVSRYAEQVGLEAGRVSPHVLRHTFCARLAQRGASAKQIAALAGHSDVRTARLYTEGLAVA